MVVKLLIPLILLAIVPLVLFIFATTELVKVGSICVLETDSPLPGDDGSKLPSIEKNPFDELIDKLEFLDFLGELPLIKPALQETSDNCRIQIIRTLKKVVVVTLALQVFLLLMLMFVVRQVSFLCISGTFSIILEIASILSEFGGYVTIPAGGVGALLVIAGGGVEAINTACDLFGDKPDIISGLAGLIGLVPFASILTGPFRVFRKMNKIGKRGRTIRKIMSPRSNIDVLDKLALLF